MHIYVRQLLPEVAEWASWTLEKGNMKCSRRGQPHCLNVMPYMYSTAVHLIAAYLEQAAAVLAANKSEFGLTLLQCAQNSLVCATDDTTDVTTSVNVCDAATDYFLAHLSVAEVAGRTWGLMPGDPWGGLINEQDIRLVLDLVLGKLDDVFQEKKKARYENKTLAPGGKVWSFLDRRQRRRLELVSRLLRAAQRIHLETVDAATMGALLSDLVKEAEIYRKRPGIELGKIDIVSHEFGV